MKRKFQHFDHGVKRTRLKARALRRRSSEETWSKQVLRRVSGHCASLFYRYWSGIQSSRPRSGHEQHAWMAEELHFLLLLLQPTSADRLTDSPHHKNILAFYKHLGSEESFLDRVGSMTTVPSFVTGHFAKAIHAQATTIFRQWVAFTAGILIEDMSSHFDREWLPAPVIDAERLALGRAAKRTHKRRVFVDSDQPRQSYRYFEHELLKSPEHLEAHMPFCMDGLKQLGDLMVACRDHHSLHASTSLPAYSAMLKVVVYLALRLVEGGHYTRSITIPEPMSSLAKAWAETYGGDRLLRSYVLDSAYCHLKPDYRIERRIDAMPDDLGIGWFCYQDSLSEKLSRAPAPSSAVTEDERVETLPASSLRV